MNVFVTGSSGFLGRVLCRVLEARGDTVVAPSSRLADLTKRESLAAYDEARFDRIFHLAAWTQAGDFCLHHPGEQWTINQAINTSVLSWWQRSQPQAKLICIGTSCAYDPAQPLVEDLYLTGTPIESLYTYAMTKRMLLVGLLALQKQYGMRYLCVVPSTLYGPSYHVDGRQMHFIFDLIRKIVRGKELGEPVVLWGDGHQRRELVHVADFVDIMLQLDGRVENMIVNIGAGEDFSIRQFARLICSHVGFDAERIEYDTSRYVGAASKRLDTGRLRALLPDVRLTPLTRGLPATIDWFRAAFPMEPVS